MDVPLTDTKDKNYLINSYDVAVSNEENRMKIKDKLKMDSDLQAGRRSIKLRERDKSEEPSEPVISKMARYEKNPMLDVMKQLIEKKPKDNSNNIFPIRPNSNKATETFNHTVPRENHVATMRIEKRQDKPVTDFLKNPLEEKKEESKLSGIMKIDNNIKIPNPNISVSPVKVGLSNMMDSKEKNDEQIAELMKELVPNKNASTLNNAFAPSRDVLPPRGHVRNNDLNIPTLRRNNDQIKYIKDKEYVKESVPVNINSNSNTEVQDKNTNQTKISNVIINEQPKAPSRLPEIKFPNQSAFIPVTKLVPERKESYKIDIPERKIPKVDTIIHNNPPSLHTIEVIKRRSEMNIVDNSLNTNSERPKRQSLDIKKEGNQNVFVPSLDTTPAKKNDLNITNKRPANGGEPTDTNIKIPQNLSSLFDAKQNISKDTKFRTFSQYLIGGCATIVIFMGLKYCIDNSGNVFNIITPNIINRPIIPTPNPQNASGLFDFLSFEKFTDWIKQKIWEKIFSMIKDKALYLLFLYILSLISRYSYRIYANRSNARRIYESLKKELKELYSEDNSEHGVAEDSIINRYSFEYRYTPEQFRATIFPMLREMKKNDSSIREFETYMNGRIKTVWQYCG
jgi:hypothetical protein